MYTLKAHIKLSIFENILSEIKKIVNTNSNPENFFSKSG